MSNEDVYSTDPNKNQRIEEKQSTIMIMITLVTFLTIMTFAYLYYLHTKPPVVVEHIVKVPVPNSNDNHVNKTYDMNKPPHQQ